MKSSVASQVAVLTYPMLCGQAVSGQDHLAIVLRDSPQPLWSRSALHIAQVKLVWPSTVLLVPLRKTGSGESILLMQAGRHAAGFLEGP